MDLADDINKYINEQTPWKKDNDEGDNSINSN